MYTGFTSNEMSQLINYSIEANTNLLPYCCKENKYCWPAITRNIQAVIKYEITPEQYWHGNAAEFDWLLVLLSDGYPSTETLLSLARTETKCEIKNIAYHFYQHINVIFEHFKTHHGYVVLSPTTYMQSLYPDSIGRFFVYTTDKWSHRDLSDMDGAVLTFRADQSNDFPKMLTKKLGLI